MCKLVAYALHEKGPGKSWKFAVSRSYYGKTCAPAQVYVTDLEWAGKVGEAKYPIFMNHDIDWPPDAGDNKPITKDRDVYWMNKLLSD